MHISKKNEVYLILNNVEPSTSQELTEFFTFEVPGAKFMPMYRNRMWDGKIRLFDTRNYTLPSGLLYHVEQFAESRGYVISNTIQETRDDEDLPSVPLSAGGKEIALRDYQEEAIHLAAANDAANASFFNNASAICSLL